jgi:hypothetical protein
VGCLQTHNLGRDLALSCRMLGDRVLVQYMQGQADSVWTTSWKSVIFSTCFMQDILYTMFLKQSMYECDGCYFHLPASSFAFATGLYRGKFSDLQNPLIMSER